MYKNALRIDGTEFIIRQVFSTDFLLDKYEKNDVFKYGLFLDKEGKYNTILFTSNSIGTILDFYTTVSSKSSNVDEIYLAIWEDIKKFMSK